jgi:ectoine hydroxylase
MNTAVDLYPSRLGRPETAAERRDPVVFKSGGTGCPIAGEYIEEYAENGFLILKDIFSGDEISCFQREMTALRNNTDLRSRDETITEPGGGEIRSIFGIHYLSRVFEKLSADTRLAGLAEYILDDRVYVHQSRLNYKPGFRGREFYWHSDFETWHVEDGMPRMRALSISIPLTENNNYNGPLMLIPGSHMEYVSCELETPVENFRRSLKKQEYGVPSDDMLAEMVERQGIVSAIGEPGSVIIFDCNILHGSGSNISPYPRSNIFLVYNAVCNRVGQPYSGQGPRPEYIASRENIKPLIPGNFYHNDYA